MTFEELFEELMVLEEQIEGAYISMAHIEAGISEDNDYVYWMQLLYRSVNEEKSLIQAIVTSGYLQNLEKTVKVNTENSDEFNITLGSHSMAIYYRLKYLLEILAGDDTLDYVYALRYDRNKIVLSMLDELMKNPEYDHIKTNLIMFKYNIYYLNMENENNFINEIGQDMILSSNKYRTSANPATKYIDQGVLLYPSVEGMDYVISVSGTDFKGNNLELTTVIIKLLNIIASVILCEEENVHGIYRDLMNIVEFDDYNMDLKNIVVELFEILKNIQREIAWSR